ncbi:MAG: hypothetical protein ACFFCD_14235 [Promethearchaeota archaeon]
MIHNVYILKTDGTSLLSKRYGSLEVDESLISGFITAINTFASQIIQREVDEIVMGDLKFIYSRSRLAKLDVIYAVCADSETSSEEIKDIFDQVDEKFVEKYENTFNDTALKDVSTFAEFSPTLDTLVHRLVDEKDEHTADKGVVKMFKKLIRLTSSAKDSPEKTPAGEAQDTTIEITQPEGEEELSQIYAINASVVKNLSDIPTEDPIQKMALQYINGQNSIEDVILSLQLLGYKIHSTKKLLEFFKEFESIGYLKLVS